VDHQHITKIGSRVCMAAAVAFFCWAISLCYIPQKGFSGLVQFGDSFVERQLPEVRALNPYVMEHSMGYDGQFYAQLAVRPDPADPEVQRALDTPAYRARRMLLPWVAHLLGAGRPAWVLQVYALLNVASWLALAALLWRWFPPVGAERTLRWLGMLFSAGLLASVRNALADGPSLLLLAAGMRWLELRRPWLAAATLGLAGLARETSVLAGVAFLDGLRKSWRDWGRTCVQGALVVLPVALWLFYLRHVLPQEGGAGAGNFALPFSGVCNRAVSLWTVLRGAGHVPFYTWYSLALLVSLVVQACFFLLRPRWSDPWWRVGAIHAVLLAFLGDAVWAGYPGAAGRVLLPMLLAFNVALPYGRRWWAVCLLGNLSVVSAIDTLRPVGGYDELRVVSDQIGGGAQVSVSFSGPWFQMERSYWGRSRWSGGPAEVCVENPHGRPLVAEWSFGINSHTPREAFLYVGEALVWRGQLEWNQRNFRTGPVRLPPGESRWRFCTDPAEPDAPTETDPRALAFRVYDLKLEVSEPPAP